MIIENHDENPVLSHIADTFKKRKYDPVKRKEYYERTKKLKGRKKKSDWTGNLKKSAKNAAKNPSKMKSLSRDSKLKVEATIDQIGKMRKDLKDKGLAGSPRDKTLKKLQEEFTRQYFDAEVEPGHFFGQTTTDRYGNEIDIPWDVTVSEFRSLAVTGKNDLLPALPNLRNPVKKLDVKKLDVDLQNPFGKKVEKWEEGLLKEEKKADPGASSAPTPRKPGKASKQIEDLRGKKKKKHWWD